MCRSLTYDVMIAYHFILTAAEPCKTLKQLYDRAGSGNEIEWWGEYADPAHHGKQHLSPGELPFGVS